jgi:hypothetical protein
LQAFFNALILLAFPGGTRSPAGGTRIAELPETAVTPPPFHPAPASGAMARAASQLPLSMAP